MLDRHGSDGASGVCQTLSAAILGFSEKPKMGKSLTANRLIEKKNPSLAVDFLHNENATSFFCLRGCLSECMSVCKYGTIVKLGLKPKQVMDRQIDKRLNNNWA